uniref:Clathrin light chain n=1 Tax=Astyanax mexicanus TaxID=7994 RepID=A0A8B9HQK0_ASTMX
MDDFDMLGNAGNGVGTEEDPAAAFLAQQESEIAGIEQDEGFSILDGGEVPSHLGADQHNGAFHLQYYFNGFSCLLSKRYIVPFFFFFFKREIEFLYKNRERVSGCTRDANCVLVDRAAEEAMVSELDENNPGTEWERVARLCDFNPKSSKQAKDVSRMRSVLISLKQSPLVR